MSESGCPELKDEQDETRNFITNYQPQVDNSGVADSLRGVRGSVPEALAILRYEIPKLNL
ncbi:MAG: hypothetical protein PT120_06400 [Aphanizomenon gracile PMC649.10]|nr:hypothetical protein [Aphanizomenon gracile PMC638.10]MDM3853277.1 hypothetical protein [Aphanizomenon gracile PMC627.10]MDM3854539.1 hypothetical protein [Aphanizomenon gracile PMC649.10]MDM3863184.1 hypothetical protein [Aphanizomenon gracile PMC644.10]